MMNYSQHSNNNFGFSGAGGPNGTMGSDKNGSLKMKLGSLEVSFLQKMLK